MPKRSSTNVNQDAAKIVDAATRKVDSVLPKESIPNRKPRKNPAAVMLGRLGGKKGGPARAQALSAERRVEIARLAAAARWNTGTEE